MITLSSHIAQLPADRARASIVPDAAAAFLRGVFAVVLALLLGFVVLTGIRGPFSAHAPAALAPSVRAFDFNDPATLAWSFGLGSTSAEKLHDVVCEPTSVHDFVCRGRLLDGRVHAETVTVSSDGSSWAAR